MTTLDPVEHVRHILFSIAYRMLGSVAPAEDAVQDAFMRWTRALADEQAITTPKAWLTTTTTRICFDVLKSARVQREAHVGLWLPEPLATASVPDFADSMVDPESLSTAFLVLLESLSPRNAPSSSCTTSSRMTSRRSPASLTNRKPIAASWRGGSAVISASGRMVLPP